MKETICLCLLFVPFCGFSSPGVEPSKSPAAEQPALMRIVSAVRFTPTTNETLKAEVAETRRLLERFRNRGFTGAIWAVNRLPSQEEDLGAWTTECLKAFPWKPILSVETSGSCSSSNACAGGSCNPSARICTPVKGEACPYSDMKELERFLRSAAPSVHSVILDAQTEPDTADAVGLVRVASELIREISPTTGVWLAVNECATPETELKVLVKDLNGFVDGYYLGAGHSLRTVSDPAFNKARGQLRTAGKPVLRGGFVYVAPRVRPGIEQELKEQYETRMGKYETWLREQEYAGYVREVGPSLPLKVDQPLAYIP